MGMSIPLTGFDNVNKDGMRQILKRIVPDDGRVIAVWAESLDVGVAIRPLLADVSAASRAACTIVTGEALITWNVDEVRLASNSGAIWIITFDVTTDLATGPSDIRRSGVVDVYG